MILTAPSGRAWTRWSLGKDIREAVQDASFEGYSFHGLRKKAAANLAEQGCTEHEIMAITDHTTSAMVAHYTRGASQKRLAQRAIAKLSNNLRIAPKVRPTGQTRRELQKRSRKLAFEPQCA